MSWNKSPHRDNGYRFHRNIRFRLFVFALQIVFLLTATGPIHHRGALGTTEEETLKKEAHLLIAELVEAKASLEKALGDRESIIEEIEKIEQEKVCLEAEIAGLEEDIRAGKASLRRMIKSLYINGEVDVLEVILEARDIDALWREAHAYRRFLYAGERAVHQLQKRREELNLQRASLRELTQKKQELLGVLDVDGLERKIRQLEERLTYINIRLREIKTSRNASRVDPVVATPVSGKLWQRVPEMPSLSNFQRTGIVYSGYTSWYGADFHGKPTASGIPFNMYDFTCAHPFLPMGTWLLVTLNGRQVVVQVNDRGPFIPGRVLDLSWRAAKEIGLGGVARTTFEVLLPLSGEIRK